VELRIRLVDAALDATDVLVGDLVSHGVGQRLHGSAGVDAVAVEVQERVELGEALGAVAAQDGDARRSERSSAQVAMLGRQRPERGLAVHRGAATVGLVDDRPELVSQQLELFDDSDARVVQGEQVVIAGLQPVEQLEPLLLDPGEADAAQSRRDAVQEQAVLSARYRATVGVPG